MNKIDIEIIGVLILFLIVAYLNHKYEWRISFHFSEFKKIISRRFKKAG